MNKLASRSGSALRGKIRVPGDKSISHRALIFGSSAVGETRIKGLLEAEDVLHTSSALRSIGATINKVGEEWFVNGVGVGGFAPPQDVINLGNSGTAARLLMGLLSTQNISAHLTGDASLRSRPMGRVIEPLSRMGASFDVTDGGHMPIVVHGSAEPIPIEYNIPVPSAQVKSAILLAGLSTPGKTIVNERLATRDHTENMLRSFGATVVVDTLQGGGKRIEVEGYPELVAGGVTVPGDPSSAAYPGVAALLSPGSDVTIENVGLNPLRTGLFNTLVDMGADIEFQNKRNSGGEPIGDITFRYRPLRGIQVPADRAPSMIDEYPIAAVAAAFATGATRLCGLAELRIKESDRFSGIINGLNACGVSASADEDDIVIEGCGGPPPGSAEIETKLDHRMAMSFLVMGMGTQSPIGIDNATTIGTSFPGFLNLMTKLGGKIGLPDE